MKKKSLSDLLDAFRARKAGGSDEAAPLEEEAAAKDEAPENGGSTAALIRLGAAFLARLHMPEGMSTGEAVDAILSMWENGGTAEEPTPAQEAEAEAEEAGEESENELPARLPRPLRGGYTEAPEADYESMSAERFRRLKKELQRASMDGRRIRL